MSILYLSFSGCNGCRALKSIVIVPLLSKYTA